MISKTALVSSEAKIGKNVQIWHFSQIREKAVIGDDCIIGKNVYIDHGVKIGSKVKIQNNTLIYHGSTLEDEVFIGPAVCLTNDKFPRSTAEGRLKKSSDWQSGKIIIEKGASIGAGSVVITGIKIGKYAMIGAGSVVTRTIPDHALAFGNPARIAGFVCQLGHTLKAIKNPGPTNYRCDTCKENFKIKNER